MAQTARITKSFVALGLILVCCFTQAETVDRVIARVNEDILMASDIAEAVSGHPGALKKRFGADDIMKSATPQMIRGLIDRTLLLQYARKEKVDAPPRDIDRQVEQTVTEIQAEYPSRAAFLEELAAEEFTLSDFKKSLRKRAEADYKTYILVMRRLGPEILPRDRNTEPSRLRLRRLAVAIEGPGEAARNKAASKVRDIALRIAEEGISFGEGVRKYTEIEAEKETGGDLGFYSAEKLSENVRTVVEQLEPGQASKPVIAGEYACVFYVEVKRGAAKLEQEKLFVQERDKLLQELRNKARIQFFEDHLQKLYEQKVGEPKTKPAEKPGQNSRSD